MDRRTSPFASFWSSVAALSLGLVLATLILVFQSADPGRALGAFYLGPFSNRLYLGNLLNQASLLILTGLGTAVAFSAGSFNLGGEGQVYLGALAALAFGLWLSPALGLVGLILILMVGALTGAALGSVSGFLKVKTGADELITSFLLSAACLPLVDSLLASPALRPDTGQLISTRALDPAFWLPVLLPPSKLSWGALISLPLAVGLYLFLFRTTWGFKLRTTGQAPRFAETSGYVLARFSLWPLFASGSLMGLAGALGIVGTHHALIQGFSFGLGWNGISAALIARNNPLLVIPAAIFLAYLDQASRAATILSAFPYDLGSLVQGVILLVITSRTLVEWLRRRSLR